MKLWVLFALCLFYLQAVFAQNANTLKTSEDSTGIIYGMVFDELKYPLPNTTIYVRQQGIQKAGLVTDFDGNYTLNIKPGIYDFEVIYIGYKRKSYCEVPIKYGECIKMNINMDLDSSVLKKIQQVIIKPKRYSSIRYSN